MSHRGFRTRLRSSRGSTAWAGRPTSTRATLRRSSSSRWGPRADGAGSWSARWRSFEIAFPLGVTRGASLRLAAATPIATLAPTAAPTPVGTPAPTPLPTPAPTPEAAPSPRPTQDHGQPVAQGVPGPSTSGAGFSSTSETRRPSSRSWRATASDSATTRCTSRRTDCTSASPWRWPGAETKLPGRNIPCERAGRDLSSSVRRPTARFIPVRAMPLREAPSGRPPR